MNALLATGSPGSRPWFLRSKLRLLLTLFLILAIPATALTLLVAIHVRHHLEEQAVYENSLTTQLISTTVGEEFNNLKRFVEGFALRGRVIGGTSGLNLPQLRGKLTQMTHENTKISRAFVTDAAGNLIADVPETPELAGKNFSDRDWFKGAAAQKGAYISGIYQRTNVDGAFVLTICTRVEDSKGRTVGYLGGQLTTDSLVSWLQKIVPPPARSVALLDASGKQATSKSSPDPNLAQNAQIKKILSEKEGSLFLTNGPHSNNLASFANVPALGWTVITLQTADSIFAPIKTLLHTILVSFVFCLAGLGAVGLYWFNMLNRYEERRQQAEEELKAKAIHLKRSNEELQALCYSIAHDLRGPLRSIRGLSIALKEDYSPALDETGRDYVQRLEGSAERMDALTKDLLDYGRLSHIELTIEPLNPASVIDKTLTLFTEEIRTKGAQIEVKRPMPNVRANAVVLEQVMNNLMSNALKFVKPNNTPRIKIWAEEKETTVTLRVKDNGIGIEQAHLQRIFGIFERLHDYQSFPGTGIGLAMVRKGAERLGGRAGVESKIGEGSCFWVELPKP